MAVRSLVVAAAVAVVTGLGWPGASVAIAAAGSHSGYCTAADQQAVTLVIDYQDLGGGIDIRCVTGVSSGVTGYGVLQAAGVSIAGTVHDGPGFACRINGRPGPTEKIGIPGNPNYTEQCVNTPPTTAFWGYWWANNGGSWTFSQGGAMSHRAVIGGFEGWSFSHNAGAASNPPPGVSPVLPAPPPTTTKPPATTKAPATTKVPAPSTPRPSTTAPRSATPRPTTAAPATARPTTSHPASRPVGTSTDPNPPVAAGGSTAGAAGSDPGGVGTPTQTAGPAATSAGPASHSATTSPHTKATAHPTTHTTKTSASGSSTAATTTTSHPTSRSPTTTSVTAASAPATQPSSTGSAVAVPVVTASDGSSDSTWVLTALAGVLILGGGAAAFLLARRRSGSP